eukprot:8711185-Pyramimonas_sp.AAC.1
MAKGSSPEKIEETIRAWYSDPKVMGLHDLVRRPPRCKRRPLAATPTVEKISRRRTPEEISADE